MRAAVFLLAVLAACEHPNARLTYVVSNDPAQSCGTTSCKGIKLPCDAVISIRIVDPDDPTVTLHSTCELLTPNRDMDLCAISSVELTEEDGSPLVLPAKTLEFQMVVWPLSAVETETGDLDCGKYEVKFDAVYGFPISQEPAPAVGGHTFYHAGDDEIRLELGCTNLDSLKSCNPNPEVEFRTSVRSFDNIDLFVARPQGMQLDLDVGEPKLRGSDIAHSLRSEDLQPMNLDITTPFTATWTAKFAPDFIDIACVQVFEQVSQSTATVKCTTDNIPTELPTLDLPDGVLLPKATLEQILQAVGLAQFPANGMTVGIVVNENFAPRAGQVVTTTKGTIRYLSQDRTNANGTATASHGIFVSLDAEFGAKLSVDGAPEEIGGRVQDKVTVVVIRKL